MPSAASRRKAKQAKKLKTLTTPNHHSSPADQLRGTAVFANRSKKMEESPNGTLQESQKEETQSLSHDNEVAVKVDDSPGGDIAITDEEAPQSGKNKELIESGKVEETEEDVSESVAETSEPEAVKDAQVGNTVESGTVEWELKEEQGEHLVSEPDVVKETDLHPSVSGNEGLRETEVVAEEEKNVLSSVVTKEVFGDSSLPQTDVASEETVETSVPKSDESDKVAPTIIEKSLEPSLDEKVEEPSGGQEESSHESAKEPFQPSPTVLEAESTENPTIAPVAQRENSPWKSCCGIFEIMLGGGR
ncbi:heat shock 70 kDa protein 18 [Spatholobus suberectus]|nr:heat shock 70 kDa protein 18 [Spatholobus suberectus]